MTYQPKDMVCIRCNERRATARRLCKRCYYQLYRTGEHLSYRPLGPDDVFWPRVEKGPGCWLWTGKKNDYGYGIFLLPGERQVRAHRYAYEQAIGPIPSGAILMHSCDNPACVNPAHLRPGTRGENNRDSVAKGRNARGESNGHAKLTANDVALIRADLRPQVEIARDFDLSQSYVSQLKAGSRWRHTWEGS